VATDAHYDTVIDSACILKTEDGETIGAYIPVDRGCISDLERHLDTIKFTTSSRTSGMKAKAMIFGAQPRSTLRRDYCTMAGMSWNYPEPHRALVETGAFMSEVLKAISPDTWRAQRAQVEGILPVWRFGDDSVFTSGIANLSTAHTYHRDKGNFPGSWNCMLAWLREADGGRTVFPAIGAAFDFSQPALTSFHAEQYLHGVTRIRRRPGGKRYSVVYYAMKGLTQCGTPDEEIERFRRVRTERERKRRSGKKG